MRKDTRIGRTAGKSLRALVLAWLAFVAVGTLPAQLPAPCLLVSPDAAPTGPLRTWLAYRTIMWIGDTAYKQPAKLPLFFQRLREMGINTAMVYGSGDPQSVAQNHFPYYVENIVNRGLCLKWNSKVTDWDGFVTDWAKSGRPESALVRDYCLDDPQWRRWASEQVRETAAKNRAFQPVAYNLRDELSVTISANPFDYDFGPIALAQFRQWLKTQYPSLQALNAEWETGFSSWDDVKPFTTDQIKNRMASGEAMPHGKPDWQALEAIRFDPLMASRSPTRWNFSPWADFRSYMDLSLARSLNDLRDAAHGADPETPAGIEGTQMASAFGGYDLWRLSQALDWVEPYDIAGSREILGSFMPGKPMVTTVFESDAPHARRRLWHLLLEGDCGCLVWWSEDCIDWKSDDYRLTAKAKAMAPVLNEMTSPLARLFLKAIRERDPIYLLYSQPSIQVDWLLESTVDGSTWLRRFSSFEADHNHMAKTRVAWLEALEDLGWSPIFVSSDEVKAGALKRSRPWNAALVLPSCHALSDAEILQMNDFLSAPAKNVILWDGAPGKFDEHGKLRVDDPMDHWAALPAGNSIASVWKKNGEFAASTLPGDIANYSRDRLNPKPRAQSPTADWIASHLNLRATEVSVPESAHVRVHRFRVTGGRLLAFERNIEYQMSEDLKQAGGNETLEKPIELDARLAQAEHVYDLRTGAYLGKTNVIHFVLDPWQPSLFGLAWEKVPTGSSIFGVIPAVKR